MQRKKLKKSAKHDGTKGAKMPTLTMKELQKFPVIFTFKIIGDAAGSFSKSVYCVFSEKDDATFVEKESGQGNYLSISVTAEIKDYEELEYYYTEIGKIDGMKFYV